jgi:hypothetical protein
MEAGCVTAYPYAPRFLRAIPALGRLVAAALSSKNESPMMQHIHLRTDDMLLETFDANVWDKERQGRSTSGKGP